VERAAACVSDFELGDCTAPTVAEICSRLDGIALAIELAAARVEEFGVRGLAAGLDDRFRLLSRGSRTATDRHRTLRGALDWSYQLLTQEEQRIFRRLAVFAGGLTFQAACAVAASNGDGLEDVPEIVASLVVKSLAVTDLSKGSRGLSIRRARGERAMKIPIGRARRLRKVVIKRSILASRQMSVVARFIRVAGIIGLIGLVSACDGTLDRSSDPELSGTCLGFAGMPVPDCNFYRR